MSSARFNIFLLCRIGKSKVDSLLGEAVDAINYLESDPVSTDDFVSYIKFVDKALQKVDAMEAQLDYVKELYDIMEEYGVPVPAEDIANYLVSSIFRLSNLLRNTFF